MEPQGERFTAGSGDVNQIVQATVRFLPALEAILRRNVAVSRVKSGSQVGAFADILQVVPCHDEIHATLSAGARNGEFAERSNAVAVQRVAARIDVSVLRHIGADCAIRQRTG